MKCRKSQWLAWGMLALAAVSSVAWAESGASSSVREHESKADPAEPSPVEYSPVVRDETATNLYWGDTHLHTRNSADAFNHANEGITRDDAFRLAMGLPVTATNGMQVRLRRPHDFLVVTDHAEYLGVFAKLKDRDEGLMSAWPLGREWGRLLQSGQHAALGRAFVAAIMKNDAELRAPRDVQQSAWDEASETADRYNQPGRFTAFIGYEWTSMISGDNLHRVVLFKDGAAKTRQVLPFSAQDSTDPEKLWEALDQYEKKTGGEVLAIAHNGNLSNGRMFAPTTIPGGPLTKDYAVRRSRWEPVYEVTQIKGDGETHPWLSPNDEFADFERWDRGNIILTAPKQNWMLRHEYARSALQEGLLHQASLGVNPFKFGMIGSTDSHTGFSTTTEDNFWGKFPETEPSPGRLSAKMAGKYQEGWELGASGLAAVWASENTRDALFAAFKRREVYGTTGSRIVLRFFGGWNYVVDDVNRPDYARVGYRGGVPMGGTLVQGPAGKAPKFMVVATKDPDEANLDRIQIIKGWVDPKGNAREAIYDVALSNGRKVDPKTGKAPPVGSTVDVERATYTNAIGAVQLAAVWQDPDFDSTLRTFYYARVLEIPKPRWTAYDAQFYGLTPDAKVPMTVQDRAYSSPIWYEPAPTPEVGER